MNITRLQYHFFKQSRYKPFLIASLVFATLALFSLATAGVRHLGLHLLSALFFASIAFLIFHTGRITRFRRVVFFSQAALFIAMFFMFSGISHPAFTCPVSLSCTLPAVVRALLAHLSAWHLFIPAFLWAGIALFSGRAWCSWLCGFGGFDECCAALAARPRLRLDGVVKRFSELPAAILLSSMLITLGSGIAVYCAWLCPFKLSSAPAVTLNIAVAAVIGIVFIVLLSFLAKTRAFCRFICPLRGLLRLTSPLHPARLRIDASKCTKCGACRSACSSLAVNDDYTISPYCNLCLTCFETCPAGAIETDPPAPLFLLLALLLSGMLFIIMMTKAATTLLP